MNTDVLVLNEGKLFNGKDAEQKNIENSQETQLKILIAPLKDIGYCLFRHIRLVDLFTEAQL